MDIEENKGIIPAPEYGEGLLAHGEIEVNNNATVAKKSSAQKRKRNGAGPSENGNIATPRSQKRKSARNSQEFNYDADFICTDDLDLQEPRKSNT